MKHIVLFGDSLFGRFGRDLILLLESSIENSRVYNCAAGGLDTRDGVKQAKFIAKLKPNYFCISFGANDCSPFKGRPVSPSNFDRNLKSILRAFRGSKVIFFLCPPTNNSKDLKETKNFNRNLFRYNQIIRKIASSNKAQIIDSEEIFGKLLRRGRNYHDDDGIHLNHLGYQIFIKQLSKLIS